MSIPSSLVPFAHSKEFKKTTYEEHWNTTQFNQADWLNHIEKSQCLATPIKWVGCIEALNSLISKPGNHFRFQPTLNQKKNGIGWKITEVKKFDLKDFKGDIIEHLKSQVLSRRKARVSYLKNLKAFFEEYQLRNPNLYFSDLSLKSSSLFESTQDSLLPIESTLTLLNSTKEKNLSLKFARSINRQFSVSLDPHTYIESTSYMNDVMNRNEEDHFGIGIHYFKIGPYMVLTTVLEESPAKASGLQAFDLISHVNDKAIKNLELNEISELIKKAPSKKLNLTLFRDGNPSTISVTRKSFKTPNVQLKLHHYGSDNFARLIVNSFMPESTCEEFEFKLLDALDHEVTGLLLDLRNNGGGLLHQASCIANYLVDGSQVITKTINRKTNEVEQIFYSVSEPLTILPVTVLTNSNTASASEILSGALQDLDRSWVVGRQSFGKASVQAPIDSFQGNNRISIYQTVAEYRLPSGRSVKAQGITPDFKVERTKDDDFFGKVQLREKDLPYYHLFQSKRDGSNQPKVNFARDKRKAEINDCLNNLDYKPTEDPILEKAMQVTLCEARIP